MPNSAATKQVVRRFQTLIGLVIFAVVVAFAALFWRQSLFIADFREDVHQSCLARQRTDIEVKATWESLASETEDVAMAREFQHAADNVRPRDCTVYGK